MNVSGRTVLLTGASGGIGSALVDELIARGARVLAVGRNRERLSQLVARSAQGAVVPIVADVASADGRQCGTNAAMGEPASCRRGSPAQASPSGSELPCSHPAAELSAKEDVRPAPPQGFPDGFVGHHRGGGQVHWL